MNFNKPLPVKERIKIYEKTLKNFNGNFLCIDLAYTIHNTISNLRRSDVSDNICKLLPEFLQHKPTNVDESHAWFYFNDAENTLLRKSVLEWCIRCAKEQLHQKGKNQN